MSGEVLQAHAGEPNSHSVPAAPAADPAAGRALRCKGWVLQRPVSSWSLSAAAATYSSEVVVPVPGPGQVRVKVYAAAVNPLDVKRATLGRTGGGLFRRGSSSSGGATSTRRPPPEFPFPYVMGVDGAGVVESVGWSSDDVQQQQYYGLQVGDRVAFLADMVKEDGGSFCQYAVVPADAVGKLPPPTPSDVIDFVEAAALPCATGTAYVALFDKLCVEAGRSIFINGASGGVGSAAVQLAKCAGLCVLASCSTVNASYVQELGADYVFDYTAVDVVDACLAYTQGFGVDYVLEVADAATALQHADALRFGGAICVVPGHMPASSEALFRRQISVSYVSLGGLHDHPLTRGNLRRVVENTLGLYQSGAFRLQLETVPLERAGAAFDFIALGHTRGKIVLTDFHPNESPGGDEVIGTRRRRQAKKQKQ
ncbi:oxidoreductase [Trypanosoma grayi]|uniref:oxidoreductase n=1 Tax=Trypanosoma grayi TaxID=71804 RepID=UPI0004F4A426|nr:oxidoreductase [Trypanosoma grayi]KEG08638.1 oxidoreductase [Trypanosoma grayi]